MLCGNVSVGMSCFTYNLIYDRNMCLSKCVSAIVSKVAAVN